MDNKDNVQSSSIEDLTDNQYMREILNNKFFKYFTEDTSSKVAMVTAFVTLGSFFIKLLDYMTLRGYLSVFSMYIDYSYYSTNQGLSEFLLQSVIFIGTVIATSFSYLIIEELWIIIPPKGEIRDFIKKDIRDNFCLYMKKLLGFILSLLVVIFLKATINLLIWSITASAELIAFYGVLEWLIVILLLSFIEFGFACVLFIMQRRRIKKNEKYKNKISNEPVNPIKNSMRIQRPVVIEVGFSSIIFFAFLCVTFAYFSGVERANKQSEFAILDNKYAIIYQADEYYWTVKASIDEDTIQLYTYTQKTVPISNTEIIKNDFDSVNINYDT